MTWGTKEYWQSRIDAVEADQDHWGDLKYAAQSGAYKALAQSILDYGVTDDDEQPGVV